MKKAAIKTLVVSATYLAVSGSVLAQSASIGAIKIDNAYTRATAPGQSVAGGFMKIENKGAADQLVSASSPAAGEMQLHEMAMDGNVMKMREVKSIAVPANGVVDLKHGGLHLMFINIKTPFAAGTTIPVKLKFAKAGDVDIKLPVESLSVKHDKH